MKITVILADTHRTRIAIIHENESIPYRLRSATIELTPEQMALVQPREVGMECGKTVYEELHSCFIERE